MELSIEGLSVELIELLLSYLDLADIKALRLACRTLKAKASNGVFTKFFTHKTIELTTTDLTEMIEMTGQGRLGLHLKFCTIAGVAQNRELTEYYSDEESIYEEGENPTYEYDKDEDRNAYRAEQEALRIKRDAEIAEIDRQNARDQIIHAELLTKAFINLSQYSPNHGLTSLRLTVNAVETYFSEEKRIDRLMLGTKFNSWQSVWDSAASAFDVTLSALTKSQLLVHDALDIFGNVKGCSLSYDTFIRFARTMFTSGKNFSTLKNLTLSLSVPHKDVKSTTYDTSQPCVTGQKFSSAVLQYLPEWLQHMPELESLDYHWYNLGELEPCSPGPQVSTSTKHDEGAATKSSLQKCALRGVFVTESDLLKFLRIVNPTSLTMNFVQLVLTPSFDGVFAYLTSPDSSITSYYLDDICLNNLDTGDQKLVHYENAPGSAKFPYLDGPIGPSTLTREPERAKNPIRYRFATRRALGSGERYVWLDEKEKVFGRLNRYKYDFVGWNRPPVEDDGDSDSEDPNIT